MGKLTLRLSGAGGLQPRKQRRRRITPNGPLCDGNPGNNRGSSGVLGTLIRAIAVMLLLLEGAAAQAPNAAIDGSALRAAYVFNFGKYIEWPATGDTEHLRVCSLDTSPVTAILNKAQGKKAQGREVQIVSYAADELETTLSKGSCNIVYVGACEDVCMKLLENVAHQPILLVSERKGAGIVRFVDTASKVGFTINKSALDAAGLKMSSQVLDIAMKEE